MAEAFNQQVPGQAKTWKDVATEWVQQECPIPAAELEVRALLEVLPVVCKSKKAFRLGINATPEERARHPRGTILGMGTVH